MIIYSIIFVLLLYFKHIHAACWKGSYGRGVGVPFSQCADGYELSGALCYPKCQDGYTGGGPVCWENCGNGYDDHGATCFRNAHIYGKGCCCTSYDVPCCFKCTSGYKDDGCTCRKDVEIYFKKSYTRTAGVPMICKSDEEQSGALCYSPCEDGYYGVGPVCWFSCTGTYAYDCGLFCSKNSQDCIETSIIISAIPVASLVLLIPENKCDGS